jgi:hypothetical protein
MGSVRKISTLAGLLGGKRGAPTYCVVVASMVAQDTSMQTSAANNKHVKIEAKRPPMQTAAAEATEVRVRAWVARKPALFESMRVECIMVESPPLKEGP